MNSIILEIPVPLLFILAASIWITMIMLSRKFLQRLFYDMLWLGWLISALFEMFLSTVVLLSIIKWWR